MDKINQHALNLFYDTLAISGGIALPIIIWYFIILLIGLFYTGLGLIDCLLSKISEVRERKVWEVTKRPETKTYLIRFYMNNKLMHKFELPEDQMPPLGGPDA